MADHDHSRLDPDSHLLLEHSLLRLPNELLKRNLKSAQREIETVKKSTMTMVDALPSQSKEQALSSLDAQILKQQNMLRKLEALQDEGMGIIAQQKARVQHVEELHKIPSLKHPTYEQWSHIRLDRLLIDYLLRQGLTQTSKELAVENNLGELVDIGVFEESGNIAEALRKGELKSALAWCAENKTALKKNNKILEHELRLQQTIELARPGDPDSLTEAVQHARKHLVNELTYKLSLTASGIIAYPSDTQCEPYKVGFDIPLNEQLEIPKLIAGTKALYSSDRYTYLASLFVQTHHSLLGLPDKPLLHIALSAGLSALKTPACHSQHALSATANTGAPVCPICSTELNEIAKKVPYAHHTTSEMEDDPVVLPNGRVFGLDRLQNLNEKMGQSKGWYMDPTKLGEGGDVYEESELKKVFIS